MIKQLIVFCLIATMGYAQEEKQELFMGILPSKNGQIYFEKIGVVDSISKAELYRRAKIAIVEHVKSAKDAIDYDDPITGQIIAKVNITIDVAVMWSTYPHTISFKINFDTKDGKYRYIMKDFTMRTNTPTSARRGSNMRNEDYPLEIWLDWRPKANLKYAQEIKERIEGIQQVIDKAMNKPVVDDGF
ncbi:MAG TPA: DUF4468 domain-containing protein [Bacteroidia bacterium]|nr:DUF4468 domain-containing protein [Bacteroidia bacterium]HRC14493.1 DUF4468 domain-containing protein [Bacteroidia bacterium]HRC36324.1 DUF4468 domain-containing protein [Bacteroidia bacterium]